jgi:multidrug efflux system membrane fusion protein
VSRRSKLLAGVLLVLAALATIIYITRWKDPLPGAQNGPGGGRGGRAGMPVSVRTVAARSGSIDVTIDALGTVTAHNTAVVHSRVDGLLERINFQEGHEVKTGAVLAEIDARPFAAALEQVQGQLARDEALLTSARSDLDRYQTLLAQDSIAKQQVDDQAALVRQYGGTVQTDRGAVANARLQLDWTKITAPIPGRVGLRQVDVGNMVHAADTTGLVVLTQTEPINVVFAVPADSAPDIQRRWKSGAKLAVDAYDRDDKTLLAHGTLESADNVVDTTTSTVRLKAVFDNSDGALFPNQFVYARITLTTLENQTLVPATAVQRGTPGTFVYVANADSTVNVRKITLGVAHTDFVAVTAGLKPGEQVVIEGTDKLKDGGKIEAAVDAPAAPAAGTRNKDQRKGNAGASGAAAPAGPAPAAGAADNKDPATARRRRPDAGGPSQ